MQIKTTSHPLERLWFLLKTQKITMLRCREFGTFVQCGWQCEMEQLLWKTLWQFLEANQRTTQWPSNFTPRCISKRIWKQDSDTWTEMFMAALFIIAKVEASRGSMNKWLDKQNVICIYKGILLSHKKEWSFDICYNMNGPVKHYAKWNRPDTQGSILHDFIYIRYQNKKERLLGTAGREQERVII